MLNKNEDNLDNSLRLMAPFYRVFANTLGNGPWFDTYIQNLPPVPQAGGEAAMPKKLIVPVVLATARRDAERVCVQPEEAGQRVS